jgi:hypothetical protein
MVRFPPDMVFWVHFATSTCFPSKIIIIFFKLQSEIYGKYHTQVAAVCAGVAGPVRPRRRGQADVVLEGDNREQGQD